MSRGATQEEFNLALAGAQISISHTGLQIIGVSLLGDAFIGFLQEYTLTTMKVKLSQMMAAVYALASGLVLLVVLSRGELYSVAVLVRQTQGTILFKPLLYGVLSYARLSCDASLLILLLLLLLLLWIGSLV